MKRLAALFFILTATAFVQAQSNQTGTVAQIKGNEIIVRYGNADKPFQAGEKLHIDTDGKTVTLEVTFPMQASAKCRVIEGSRSLLKAGLAVYAGAKPAEKAAPAEKPAEPEKTVALQPGPVEIYPAKLGDFTSLIGFSPRNTISDVIAKLGKPTEVKEHDSSYNFNTAYWKLPDANNSPDICVRICYFKDNQKLMVIEIDSIYGDKPEGSTVRSFLASKGIIEKKANFLSASQSQIVKIFGAPNSGSYGFNDYQVSNGSGRYQVTFYCPTFKQNVCTQVSVHYFR